MRSGWRGVAVAVCLMPVSAGAQDEKGAHQLWAQCQAINSLFEQGVCLGYLGAALDRLRRDTADPEVGISLCLPDPYPNGRLREDFLAHLDGNRDARDLPALEAIQVLVLSSYRCTDPAE